MKRYQIIIGLFIICLISTKLNAQINPLGAQYFQNPYLANPSLAGYQGGLTLNSGYRYQWSNIPGTPRTQNLTLDYGKEKIGMGLNVMSERKAGFIQTKIQGSFAYHMPLSAAGNKLHFGLSLGIDRNRFSTENMIGNPNDLSVQTYNDRQAKVDGDFGIAYTSDHFELEGAAYNLNSLTKKEDNPIANYSQYYLAASHILNLAEWKLKSRFAYRIIENYTNIADMGVELKTTNDKIGLSGMYHTNKSTSVGISYLHQAKWQFVGLYNTSTSPIANYALGSFEVGLKVRLSK